MTPPVARARGGLGERFAALVRLVERDRKITKERFNAVMGVRSESSFKRYKKQLAGAGMAIVYDCDDKYYHVVPGAAIARHEIDPRTRAQLAQVRAVVSAIGGPIAGALEEALTFLDARIAIGDSEGEAVVTSRHPQPSAKAFFESFDRALAALSEHRWLSFAYSRADGILTDRRTVAPYAVHLHNGRYYVWGVTEGEPEPKLYALDGMSDVAIEDDEFDPDPGLSIDDALRYSFGTLIGAGSPQRVVVRVEPTAAAFVRCRRWPAEVERRDDPDGSVRLTFELTRFGEIVGWVASFRGAATIVSPPEARAELHAAAVRLAAASTAARMPDC